jgi:hypothetical protein
MQTNSLGLFIEMVLDNQYSTDLTQQIENLLNPIAKNCCMDFIGRCRWVIQHFDIAV